jgi:hypothetical protein
MNALAPTLIGRFNDPNRVTGAIASLAASGETQVTFDLGQNYDQYSLVQVIIDPTSPETALNTITIYGTDSVGDILSTGRILGVPGAATPSQAKFTNLAPATGAQAVWVRPLGRFIVVDFKNNDATNALGAGAQINFAAYAGC